MGSVGRDVAAFVVSVDGHVETHELDKFGVVVAEEFREVCGPVQVWVDLADLAILVDVAVDTGSDKGQLGNEVHRVFVNVFPVRRLVHARSIGLGEAAFVLEGSDGERELAHRVEGVRAAVQNVLDVRGDGRAGRPFSGESLDFLLGRHFTGNKEPEKSLRQRLLAALGSGQSLLKFGDTVSAETDTLWSEIVKSPSARTSRSDVPLQRPAKNPPTSCP